MKTHYLAILILMSFLSISCKAQQTIKNLDMEDVDFQSGFYYKDLNNKLNPYVGTWLYTNGSTSLKIVIKKKEHFFFSSLNYYSDLLVGDFQYIENNTVIQDRLSILDNPIVDNNIYETYSIVGHWFKNLNSYPLCPECSSLLRRVIIDFQDPTRPYLNFKSSVGLNGDIENEQLIFFIKTEISAIPDDLSPTTPTIPDGKYILNKLP